MLMGLMSSPEGDYTSEHCPGSRSGAWLGQVTDLFGIHPASQGCVSLAASQWTGECPCCYLFPRLEQMALGFGFSVILADFVRFLSGVHFLVVG